MSGLCCAHQNSLNASMCGNWQNVESGTGKHGVSEIVPIISLTGWASIILCFVCECENGYVCASL